jgi:hypothetical protein
VSMLPTADACDRMHAPLPKGLTQARLEDSLLLLSRPRVCACRKLHACPSAGCFLLPVN